jgi:hypothetical protein
MPPVIGVRTANHHAQRWMPSIVALKPMVQRQNRAARSDAVPRSTICSSSRSPPKRVTAGWSRRAWRTAAPSRRGTRSRGSGTGCSRGCRSGSRRRWSSRGAGRCRRAPPRTTTPSGSDGTGRAPGTARSPTGRPRQTCLPILCMGQLVGADPPAHHRDQQEEAGDDVPAAVVQRRHAQPVFGARRLQRQPEQLADELGDRPADLGQHVQADDVQPQRAGDERDDAGQPR